MKDGEIKYACIQLGGSRSCWCTELCGAELMGMQFPLHQPETVVLQVPL